MVTVALGFLLFINNAHASVEMALRKCLVGRGTEGMPTYNLGYGYVCDQARAEYYAQCVKTYAADLCLTSAHRHRNECRLNTCPFVEAQCLVNRCTKYSNDFECFDEGKFGYYGFSQNVFVFQPVLENEVPSSQWWQIFQSRRRRCEKGERVSLLLLSAKVYGHNCQHATNEVGRCLLHEGVKDVKVAVFGKESEQLPEPPGDISHSMLTIPHPTKAGSRCLVESQRRAEKGKPVVDEECCYSDFAGFFELPAKGCKNAFYGPFRVVLPFESARYYGNVATFLKERGTEDSEVP